MTAVCVGAEDVTAYARGELTSMHITASIAIDEATMENGPLEFAGGRHLEGVVDHTNGVLDGAVEAEMKFTPLLVEPGDVVLFDSWVPHRSGQNLSNRWRRSAFLTFNKASEGDLHGAYYAKKRAAMTEGVAGSISINKDFGGTIIT